MENLKIISNTSPLINLCKIDHLGLIEKLFGQIIIPEAVNYELFYNKAKTKLPELRFLFEKSIIIVKTVKNKNFVNLLRSKLDYGEAEAIALAVEMKADSIILDETEARKEADNLKIKKFGFIGILIKAKKNGLIDDIKSLIDMAIKNGFWLKKDLYNKIIRQL